MLHPQQLKYTQDSVHKIAFSCRYKFILTFYLLYLVFCACSTNVMNYWQIENLGITLSLSHTAFVALLQILPSRDFDRHIEDIFFFLRIFPKIIFYGILFYVLCAAQMNINTHFTGSDVMIIKTSSQENLWHKNAPYNACSREYNYLGKC